MPSHIDPKFDLSLDYTMFGVTFLNYSHMPLEFTEEPLKLGVNMEDTTYLDFIVSLFSKLYYILQFYFIVNHSLKIKLYPLSS